jgi:hypothetical protein
MCSIADSSATIVRGNARDVSATIGRALAPFGAGALAFAAKRDIKIVALAKRQRYRDASPSLRRLGVDVDTWPVPPAGLFVVEERSIYLRSATPMTVAHEFSHGLDCALGGGVYRSSYDLAVRRAFARARDFVTPYAATGLDEYFAESMRAYVEVNDTRSPWPKATRMRLRGLDPAMHAYMESLFDTDLARDAAHGDPSVQER